MILLFFRVGFYQAERRILTSKPVLRTDNQPNATCEPALSRTEGTRCLPPIWLHRIWVDHQSCWWGYNYIVSKLKRYDVENHVYFVTSKTLNNKPIFLDHAHAELFINNLLSCRRRYGFLLLGFVLMPDHFHALIMPKTGFTISSVMQKIKSLFAYRLRKLGVKGTIWQKSFYDFGIYSQEKCR